MKLYFGNCRGERRAIADVTNDDEVITEIRKFCDERNYKIPYIRVWKEGRKRYYGVGSHSEFFILELVNKEELENGF